MRALFPARDGWFRRVLVLASLCVILPVLGLFGRWHWTLDLLSHFRFQYAAALLACGLALALFRRPLLAVAAALAALVLLAPYARYFVPSPGMSPEPSLKLVVFNVNTANDRHAEVVDFLAREDADIAILQEVDTGWVQSLDALESQYPHRFGVARDDNFGIVALSKKPFLSPQVRPFGRFGIPWLTWHIERNGRTIRIAAAHTIPPTNALNAELRDDHLAELAEWAARPGSALVAGDLNTTIFSPRMGDFFGVSGLRDSALGFGLPPTWMAFFPPLAIPIDHVFATPDIRISSRRLGPSMGSDHRPILVEFAPMGESGTTPGS